MSEYFLAEVNPQVSVMFKDDKPVRAFIDIEAATEQLNRYIEQVKSLEKPINKEEYKEDSIKFSDSEISRMNIQFAKDFIKSGRCANIKKYKRDNQVYYEIRYRRNGYNITVTDTDLKTAKELFIKAS